MAVSARGYPTRIDPLSRALKQPRLEHMLRQFLQEQLTRKGSTTNQNNIAIDLSLFSSRIRVRVHHSATATYYAPGDPSGIGGMRREVIRCNPCWRGEPRYDCVFVETNPELDGMRALEVARVLAFLSFKHGGVTYPCALIRWFTCTTDRIDEDTGMWVVEPDTDANGHPLVAIIHLDCIVRAAHLIGVYGVNEPLPDERTLRFSHSLDAFSSFYVNKFADHHAFEIAF